MATYLVIFELSLHDRTNPRSSRTSTQEHQIVCEPRDLADKVAELKKFVQNNVDRAARARDYDSYFDAVISVKQVLPL
jgi:hypothetical protein